MGRSELSGLRARVASLEAELARIRDTPRGEEELLRSRAASQAKARELARAIALPGLIVSEQEIKVKFITHSHIACLGMLIQYASVLNSYCVALMKQAERWSGYLSKTGWFSRALYLAAVQLE